MNKKPDISLGCGGRDCASCRQGDRTDERVRIFSFTSKNDLPTLLDALKAEDELNGTVVVIPAHVRVEEPLSLPACAVPDGTVVVVLEEGSSLTLLDTVRCGCGTGPQGQRLVVAVGEGAELRLAELRCLAPGQSFVGEVRADVAAAGRLELFSALLGGGRVDSRNEISLSGLGARVERIGLSFASGDGRLEVHDTVRHFSDRTSSYIMTRGVLAGTAAANRQLLTEIGSTTVGCDGRQDCRELPLTPEARAEIRPSLEIGAEDVTCSHGASVSPPDRTAVFYLTARGLDPAVARQQLALGFFRPALERLWDEPTRAAVRQMILSRLDCRTETEIN
ncbi:MAG: SufD family Fe-S cluster assembly protein [bacterium]